MLFFLQLCCYKLVQYGINIYWNYNLLANDLCVLHKSYLYILIVNNYPSQDISLDRLFNLIKPQAAIFGKKDYQQLHLIKEFSKVSYPTIEIIGMPTIRDGNGLALSSRNNLFEKEQLIDISFFNQSLTNIVHRAQSGENYQESILFGIDASQVNQVAASLIHLRKPSAYQSKGIYKTNSVYPRKAGKRK